MNSKPLVRLLAGGAGSATAIGAGFSLYLTAIGIAAAVRLNGRAYLDPVSQGATRFRIMIPAHNEELLIKDTIAAIQAIDYPKSLYEVHVVADNCTDRTVEIAEFAGAFVHERTEPTNPGKGPALVWLLDLLPPGAVSDVVVIIDADTIVEPNLLQAFAECFEAGAIAVQGHYAVRDDAKGGETSLRGAAFAVRHFVRPAGRVQLGGSSSLYGNGMAFTEGIARTFPWSAHLTEDLDLGLRLLLAGESVDFAPGAVVRGEIPDSLEKARSQNERWETGRRAIARTYLPRLMAAAWRGDYGRRWAYLDAAFDIGMPPLGSLVATTAAGTTGLAVVGRGAARVVGVGTGLASMALLAAHVLGALRLSRAPASVYRSLSRGPLNIVWKLVLQLRTIGREPAEWVRTTRNATP